jgi:hypothetical protein
LILLYCYCFPFRVIMLLNKRKCSFWFHFGFHESINKMETKKQKQISRNVATACFVLLFKNKIYSHFFYRPSTHLKIDFFFLIVVYLHIHMLNINSHHLCDNRSLSFSAVFCFIIFIFI